MKPTPQQLFALYHLGLDEQGSYKFRNLGECARKLQVSPQEVQDWLKRARIDAETVGHVEFPLSKWHAEAQFVAQDKASEFIENAWKAYCEALAKSRGDRFHHSVDYDDLWGDGWNSDDDDRGNR